MSAGCTGARGPKEGSTYKEIDLSDSGGDTPVDDQPGLYLEYGVFMTFSHLLSHIDVFSV